MLIRLIFHLINFEQIQSVIVFISEDISKVIVFTKPEFILITTKILVDDKLTICSFSKIPESILG